MDRDVEATPPNKDSGSHAPSRRLVPRRSFLGMAALVAARPWSTRDQALAQEHKSKDILRLHPGSRLSDVFQVSASQVVNGAVVHKPLLREMLELLLTEATNAQSVARAWQALLSPRDTVGIKFNRSGQFVIGTTPSLGSALLESLIEASIPPERIVCFEAPRGLVTSYGCRDAGARFDSMATHFGSGDDNLHAALRSVTVLINVPFLKTHNIAVMSGALKNLSHGLIKHPARFHANGCSPYVSDIVALPEIKAKLRLTIMDALRVVYQGGPEATSHNVADIGSLLASSDPVAVDSVGVQLLNKARVGRSLEAIAEGPEDVPSLAAAHRSGLGMALAAGIRLKHHVL